MFFNDSITVNEMELVFKVGGSLIECNLSYMDVLHLNFLYAPENMSVCIRLVHNSVAILFCVSVFR